MRIRNIDHFEYIDIDLTVKMRLTELMEFSAAGGAFNLVILMMTNTRKLNGTSRYRI